MTAGSLTINARGQRLQGQTLCWAKPTRFGAGGDGSLKHCLANNCRWRHPSRPFRFSNDWGLSFYFQYIGSPNKNLTIWFQTPKNLSLFIILLLHTIFTTPQHMQSVNNSLLDCDLRYHVRPIDSVLSPFTQPLNDSKSSSVSVVSHLKFDKEEKLMRNLTQISADSPPLTLCGSQHLPAESPKCQEEEVG